MSEAHYDLIIRAFKVFNGADGPYGGLWWRTDGEYAPVTLMVNCNDLFFWGCADCETLTPENIDALEKAAKDVKAVTKDGDYGDAALLFCARQRELRPQGAFYSHFDKETWPLFDACGPEREVGFGNPEPHPSAKQPLPPGDTNDAE